MFISGIVCVLCLYYTPKISTLTVAHQIEVRYNVSSGAVAHRLEQAAHNHLVVGSIPTSPTNKLILKRASYEVLFILNGRQSHH
jgi:hypothetical protein